MNSAQNKANEQRVETIFKDMSGVTVAAAGPLIGDYVFKDANGGDLLRITKEAFIFRGETVQDAGAAYAAFMLAVNNHNERYHRSRTHVNISFVDEQKALTLPIPIHSSELMEDEVIDPPGKVRIYRKRDDWFHSTATEQVIDNTIDAVRKFLNTNNPVPFTEQQLENIVIMRDQRRAGNRLQVIVRVGHSTDTVTVAFLTGPLVDWPITG
jgi:hypothetical protein